MKIETASLIVNVSESANAFEMLDARKGDRLVASQGVPLAPFLDGKPVALSFRGAERLDDGTVVLSCASDGGVEGFRLRLRPDSGADAVDLSCEFTATRGCQLNALDILPSDSILNLYNVVNFRNRHHTPSTWPELLLGGNGCETGTYSDDWQFAPHPTLLIFQKLDVLLFVGALDLPQAYGLQLKAKSYRATQFRLDFGAQPWGQSLAAGETFRSPRFRIFLRHGRSAYGVLDDFAAMLVDNRIIPPPSAKPRLSWWTAPLYCTWIDQVYLAESRPPEDLQAQTAASADPTRKVLTETMVREALATIQRERLPFKTILIDEGWHAARGQWEPHTERFPNFRALVDDIHAAGLKVVVWWNWAEIEKTAEVNPAHLMAGGKPNKHGSRMRDYSLPATQEEYLKPLFRKLFSNEPGCYDLDGVKTDFLADKVHPDLPPADPAWRGEENYFLKVYELFYHEMKRWKPDAVHIGCAGNFHLAHLIDINRTYDVPSSNPMEHEERAKMLLHTAPACPVAYDFHNYLENLDEYFASARRAGASVQIGNILMVKADAFSKSERADSDYYALLRRNLGMAASVGTSINHQE